METQKTPTDLYRHFNSNDELLYVGVSLSTVKRLLGHRKASAWFEDIVNITVEKFPSREEALRAEKKAIKEEKPKYNIEHSILNTRQPPNKKAEIEPIYYFDDPCVKELYLLFLYVQWGFTRAVTPEGINNILIKYGAKPFLETGADHLLDLPTEKAVKAIYKPKPSHYLN